MKVLEVMRTHVVKAFPDAAIRDVVDLMDLYQVVFLPIIDINDCPVGVVTDFDVVQLMLPFRTGDSQCRGGLTLDELQPIVRRVEKMIVADAMSHPAIVINEHRDILEAASLMMKHGIDRLPVTSEGVLVGVVSQINICQALLEVKT